MEFDELLALEIALLQRQGRVSYRAQKMRLDIDEAYRGKKIGDRPNTVRHSSCTVLSEDLQRQNPS